MTTIAVIYHSGFGHTKLVAEAIRDGAQGVGDVEVRLLTAEEAAEQFDSLADVAGIIFGSPTYMGSVSGEMEQFFDKSSKVWFTQGWKDKLAGGFTNSGSLSGDKLSTLQRISTFAAQHSMVWVNLGIPNEASDPEFKGEFHEAKNRVGSYLGLMAQSNDAAADEVNPPSGDIATAKVYGARFAKAAKRWGVGLID